MAIPDYQTLMLPVLRHAAKGSRRVAEIASEIAVEFNLSAAERDQLLPSGKQITLHNRIQWAKFHLQKADLLKTLTRGVFTATDAGKNLLSRAPARINLQLLMEISPSFRSFMQSMKADQEEGLSTAVTLSNVKGDVDAIITPEEQIENASKILLPL